VQKFINRDKGKFLNRNTPTDDINSAGKDPIDDHDLLRRVAEGDERAFVELYQRYHVPLFNYLLRLVRESVVAEDLLQEVFVAIWKGAGRFRGKAKVKTWAFRIAHHQAVSWLRRHRRLETLPDGLPLSPQHGNPEVQAFRAWQTERLWAAMDALSPKHRAVVELAYVHAFSYADIAKVMDCPVGTVKSRMNYAMRYLSAALDRLGIDGVQV
jgi:RNA polymerase sigma-70 factor (ECF subfamily)